MSEEKLPKLNNFINEIALSTSKVVLIGLDGATFDLIIPWATNNKLPNLRRFLEEGVSANLISTVPYFTPSAWTSIVTGKNPGKHGIYDFYVIKENKLKVINSRQRKSEAIWNVLSKMNKKSIIINVPITYPPEEINGILISGMLTPGTDADFVHPKELKDYLLKEGYEIECNIHQVKDLILKESFRITETRAKIALDLMQKFEWDLFMIVFMHLDRIQHRFWKYIDPKNSQHDFGKEEKYRNTILECYQILDTIVGKFLEVIDKDVTIMIVSDHGFGPRYKTFFVNYWLTRSNLLKLKETEEIKTVFAQIIRRATARIRPVLTSQKLSKFLRMMNHGPLLDLIKQKMRKMFLYHENPHMKAGKSQPTFSIIDFSKTVVLCPSTSGDGLRIITKGREDKTTIDAKSKYSKLIRYLTRLLYDLKDSKTGNKVIKKIYNWEELYWGPYTYDAPDLVVEMNDGYKMVADLGPGKFFTESYVFTGSHRHNAIFLALGPGIKKKTHLEQGIYTWDIMPILLRIMGIPIPSDCDGNVCNRIFDSRQ